MVAPSTDLTLVLADSIDAVTRKGVPHVVDFIVLQLNDVYEAAPVEGGRRGGLARVATLCAQLRQENPNTLVVMIGDFLSPSAIGYTTNDGGKHMVEALNAVGISHATMGNHEFDISESDLVLRIAESQFKWVVSNVKHVVNGVAQPFEHVIPHDVVVFGNAAGEQVRVAVLGVCTDMAVKKWVKYQNPIESAREQVAALDGKADVFVTMTHLPIDQDKQLGTEVERLDVLLGGHEHEAARAIVGDDDTPIFKADSNARTAFVHRFRFDTQRKVATLFPELVTIDDQLADEPTTAAIVHRWENMTYETLRAQGNEPLQVVGRTAEALNGAEADVRTKPTNLTQLIADSFLNAVPGADAVMFSAGLIRIDGVIPPGDILFFDVVRIFPINGKLSVLTMPGTFVRTLASMGPANSGQGGFLVFANLQRDDRGTWLIKGEPVIDDKIYKVVIGELPAAALDYPPFKGSGCAKLYDTKDMRAIFIERLRRDAGLTA